MDFWIGKIGDPFQENNRLDALNKEGKWLEVKIIPVRDIFGNEDSYADKF